MRIKNKQWDLEILDVPEKERNYIQERLIKNQDIFHIIIENNIVLNGANVLNCLLELCKYNKMDKIEIIKFNNHSLNIIEIIKE